MPRRAQLAADFSAHPGRSLADVAYTLQTGRRAFDFRRAVVADTSEAAIAALEAAVGKTVTGRKKNAAEPGVAFLFPGQGSQRVNMAVTFTRRSRCIAMLSMHA